MSAGAVPAGGVDLQWFRKKQLRTLGIVVAFVVVFELASLVCNFSLG